MAVALTSEPADITNSTTNPYTSSWTITSGTNLCAIARITWDERNFNPRTISSVTYGGQSMTSCGAAVTCDDGSGNSIGVELFYRVAPLTGANNLVVTMSGAITDIYVDVVGLSGVSQTTPIRSGSVTTDEAPPTGVLSVAVPTISGDVTLFFHNPGSSSNATSGGTLDSENIGGDFGATGRHNESTTTSTTYSSASIALGACMGLSVAQVALTQEGFRFRNDDGSETTATWLAAQDTNIQRIQ